MPRSGIVWLASFPKSGNTWFRALLANLQADESGPVNINSLGVLSAMASDRSQFEEVTMIDSELLSYDDIDSLRPRVYESIARTISDRRWIKVHDAYTLTTSGEPVVGRHAAFAAVYLVRDPRDVVLSFARHLDCTIDDTIRHMSATNGVSFSGRIGINSQLRQKLLGWSRHVTSWLDQRDVPVHLVRFEDLIAAPADCFAAALAFVGQFANRADIERAVCHSNFAELQRQERANGFCERVSRTEPFFHSGRAGSWREFLTAEQALTIARCHGEVMARLGYAL